MDTLAVLLKGPEDLTLDTLGLTDPGTGDVVVRISHSGISTGTEKLFWNGKSLNKYFINHSKLTKGGVLKISTK